MVRLKKILFALAGLSCLFIAEVFSQRIPEMSLEELVSWRKITVRQISNDGRWATAKIAPTQGDATVKLYNHQGEEKAAYCPALSSRFSFSSDYLLVYLTPSRALTDSLERAGAKKDQMPMNRLVIHPLSGHPEALDSIRNYLLADRTDWLAYQRQRGDSTLYVRSLDGITQWQYPAVSQYRFAARIGMLYFVSAGEPDGLGAGLYAVNPEQGEPNLVKSGKGHYQQIAWDEKGEQLAFLFTSNKDSLAHALSLWVWQAETGVRQMARSGDAAFPSDWVISPHGSLEFSPDGRRLFFGTAPQPRRQEPDRKNEEWPQVQVWSWNEPVQASVQLHNLKEEQKRSYRAMVELSTGRILQLADPALPAVSLSDRGNGEFALLSTTEPYALSSMWEGTSRRDVWALSLSTGERTLLLEGDYGTPKLSPKGYYAYWYAARDSAWYAIELATFTRRQLTHPRTFTAWDEDYDRPNYPPAHGIAGWTNGDKEILIYDRYDIWRIDPTGSSEAVNLTGNGRTQKIRYRLMPLAQKSSTVNPEKLQYLYGFDETTKGSGYYRLRLDGQSEPETLLAGDFSLSTPLKARNAETVLYTVETYEQYPELHISDLSFRRSCRLTGEGTQQEGIRWGTAELVSWTSLDGKKMEGVVYKPGDFDPEKKISPSGEFL